MKRSLFFLMALVFGLCFSKNGFANELDQPSTDSTRKTITKVTVTIRDIEDGAPIDSVYVAIGAKTGYTNNKGVVEFEDVQPTATVYLTKSGYYSQSKKVKSSLQFRLIRKNERAVVATINNELYERPVEHFSGSATVVNGSDLVKINPLNFAEALKFYDPSFIVTRDNNNGDGPNSITDGKIRGSHNFPASATIASNGTNTANGVQVNPSAGDFVAENIAHPNQPVVFIDGMQVAMQTALDIDINRIDKITILKDAAATAAYGVNGGNGILLIQTKRPQKGNLRVNYTGQVQIATPDLSSYNLMDASQKLQFENAAGMYTNNPSLYQSRLSQVNKGINTDWLSIPTQTSTGTKHSLSIDGGDDDMSYGLDFSYNDMKGVMIGEKRQNAGFGGYIGSRFKNFSFNNYVSYLRSESARSPYGNLRDYGLQNAYWSPYDSVTGEMSKVLEQYVYQNDTITHYNPAYNGVISTTNENLSSRLSNITTFNWILGKGFRLNGQFGISKQSDVENIFLPPGHTIYADYSPNDFFKRGEYKQTSSDFLSWNGKAQLHYNKKIGFHQLYASAGGSLMETQSEATAIWLSGFTSDKFSDLSFGNAYANLRPTTGKIVTRLASAFSNFTYSYDNRYQLEVSANADGSSQFGDNNRVAAHWAVGASWNLHQERFFHDNKILNQFRVRGSVGVVGNQFFQSYLNRTTFNYYTDRQYIPAGSNSGTRSIGLGAYLTGYANENLKPSSISKQNLGFDAVLLQNRLAVRFDAYHDKTTDIVLPITSPSSTGFLNYSYYDNLGGIENKGIEFSLRYVILRDNKQGITWSVFVNGIHNEDKITATSSYLDLINQINDSILIDQTKPQPRYIVGQSPTAIWAVKSQGIDPADGQEKFFKGDGSSSYSWNAADKIIAGDLSPKWQGSFGTEFSIKNISAGVYFNYQSGAKYYNQTLADKIENADLTYNVDKRAASDRWTQPGDKALYKAVSLNGMLTNPTYATTRFVEDDNFLRCSAISLGYSLPQQLAAKIKSQGIRLGFIANNVFSSASRNDEQGIYYPFHKMYTFSLSTTF